jgi:hypothetical protein
MQQMKNNGYYHLTSTIVLAIVESDTGVVSHFEGNQMVDFNEGREERVRIHLRTGGGAFGGISVRDYFAAKAMAALILKSDALEQIVFNDNVVVGASDDELKLQRDAVSSGAYLYADAMLAERDKAIEDIRKEWSVEEAFGLGDSK